MSNTVYTAVPMGEEDSSLTNQPACPCYRRRRCILMKLFLVSILIGIAAKAMCCGQQKKQNSTWKNLHVNPEEIGLDDEMIHQHHHDHKGHHGFLGMQQHQHQHQHGNNPNGHGEHMHHPKHDDSEIEIENYRGIPIYAHTHGHANHHHRSDSSDSSDSRDSSDGSDSIDSSDSSDSSDSLFSSTETSAENEIESSKYIAAENSSGKLDDEASFFGNSDGWENVNDVDFNEEPILEVDESEGLVVEENDDMTIVNGPVDGGWVVEEDEDLNAVTGPVDKFDEATKEDAIYSILLAERKEAYAQLENANTVSSTDDVDVDEVVEEDEDLTAVTGPVDGGWVVEEDEDLNPVTGPVNDFDETNEEDVIYSILLAERKEAYAQMENANKVSSTDDVDVDEEPILEDMGWVVEEDEDLNAVIEVVNDYDEADEDEGMVAGHKYHEEYAIDSFFGAEVEIIREEEEEIVN